MEYLPSYGLSFLVTIILVWTLMPIARYVGLTDKPGGRKKHSGEIPLIGGIAVFGGLLVGLAALDNEINNISGLVIGGGMLLLIGTIDDFIPLSAFTRFLAQISAALIMVLSNGIMLVDLGYLFGTSTPIHLGGWSIAFTVFATVGVINAINMSDGMDGLAGGLALVALGSLAVASGIAGVDSSFHLIMLVIAAMVGFLKFNMRTPWLPRARIFLGNGGSMLLGFILAWFLIDLAQSGHQSIAPVTALWLLTLPLLDTVCIMLRRIMKGRSPFAPDREHFHHILLVAGYTPSQTVWFMILLAGCFAMLGLIGFAFRVEEHIMLTGMLALFGIYFWGMNHAWKVMKAIRKTTGGGAADNVIKPVKSSTED